jgi:hypothetical protein
MEEAGILEKITRSGFCYPALNQVSFSSISLFMAWCDHQAGIILRPHKSTHGTFLAGMKIWSVRIKRAASSFARCRSR